MSLPAYAEELKQLVLQFRNKPLENGLFDIPLCIDKNLDCILRDAEVAEAAREYINTRTRAAAKELQRLIAKETPKE